MTAREALTRYVDKFGGRLPDFKENDYWDKLITGSKWITDKFGDNELSEIAERYARACVEIMTIEYEIKVLGGVHFDKTREDRKEDS